MRAFLALVRHARARRAAPGEPDSERELSAEGRAQLEVQVERLRAIGFACERLWTSPWRRARQTADRLGLAFAVAAEIRDGLCDSPASEAGQRLEIGRAHV